MQHFVSPAGRIRGPKVKRGFNEGRLNRQCSTPRESMEAQVLVYHSPAEMFGHEHSSGIHALRRRRGKLNLIVKR